MIAIKRPAAPAFLTDPASKWQLETQSAIAHYAVSGQTVDYEFQHYNDAKVKSALKAVFKKCAYCEFNYAPGYDGDVEHFRPKGRVKEKSPQKPGYYWLANDWNNLYLSCQHCNQIRKQLLEGETDPLSRGKLDQFPLKGRVKHIGRPGLSMDKEERNRLLIDPCTDDPETHFAYIFQSGVIRGLDSKGKKSVEVYVLQRQALVESRNQRQAELNFHLETTRESLDRWLQSKTAVNKKSLDRQMDFLLTFTQADKPYAGMCRYFVRDFLKKNNLLHHLKQVG